MPVKLWWGDRTQYTTELEVVNKIVEYFEKVPETLHLFVNFRVGGAQVDLCAVNKTAIALIEVKATGPYPLMAKPNGP
jgi:hypothetical protein